MSNVRREHLGSCKFEAQECVARLAEDKQWLVQRDQAVLRTRRTERTLQETSLILAGVVKIWWAT